MSKKPNLLKLAAIKKNISKTNLSKLHSIVIFDQIDSTNNYLLNLETALKNKAYVCLAEQQLAGRGRLGRKWVSPYAANIYLSLLWPFTKNICALAGLSLAVTTILSKVLMKLGVENIELKWPNDILYQQKKLAGILIETVGEAYGVTKAIIGIGLNVSMPNSAGKEIDQPWIDLQTITNAVLDRNKIAGLIINECLKELPKFAREGLTPFMQVWQQHHYLFGKTVKLIMPNKTITGVIKGIDANGYLQLQNKAGKITAYSSGEIENSLRSSS